MSDETAATSEPSNGWPGGDPCQPVELARSRALARGEVFVPEPAPAEQAAGKGKRKADQSPDADAAPAKQA